MRTLQLISSVVLVTVAASSGCNKKDAPTPTTDTPPSAEPAATQAAPAPSAAPTETAEADAKPEKEPARTPDVEYVPTPQTVVDKMLEMVKLKKTDVLYDLGCGDGRIVVTAAKKYGVKAFGYDIDPTRVEEAKENVKKNGVEDLVTITEADVFTLDLSPANVVTLYLLPELNVRLIPQLEKLKPGSRIVSHDFDMAGVKPDRHIQFTPKSPGAREHDIYLFSVPLKKEK